MGGRSSRMMSSVNVSPAVSDGRKRTYTVFGRRSGPDESSFHSISLIGMNVAGAAKPPSLDTRIEVVKVGKTTETLTFGEFVYCAPLLIDAPSCAPVPPGDATLSVWV